MNKARRTEIGNIIARLKAGVDPEDIRDDIESVKSDEEWAFDSFPENLQSSCRGEAMQEAIDNLEEALSAIDDEEDIEVIIDYLDDARYV